MASPAESYTYTPLGPEPGAFRLLRLKKGTGAKLEAEIIHTSVKNEYDSYEAISYTWGNPEGLDHIYIDDRPLGIAWNLSLVLRDLRLPDDDRLLWNDATCINQQDLVERGSQVQNMGEYYRSARAVLICLGRPTEFTDFLMDTLHTFWVHLTQETGNQNDSALLIDGASSNEVLLQKWQEFLYAYQSQHFLTTHRLALGFHEITSALWFQRVWVIQEVYNARRGVVHCGRRFVPASIFASCGNFITPFSSDTIQSDARPLLEMMSQSYDTQHYTLFELIKAFASSKATDPYDRIYALLDMATDVTSTTALVPDYTISTGEVIANTISHIFKWEEVPRPPIFSDINSFIRVLCAPEEGLLLLWAAEVGCESVVQHLLDLGANPWLETGYDSDEEEFDKVRIYRDTPFTSAASCGHIHVVEAMLSTKGVRLRKKIFFKALRIAVEEGHADVVKRLIAFEEAEYPGCYKREAGLFHFAAKVGQEAIVKIFLDAGDKVFDEVGSEGRTPFSLAAGSGHQDVMNMLLDAGPVAVDGKDFYGRTPLSHASANGRQDIVRFLLDFETVDPDSSDRDNWTPFLHAAGNGKSHVMRLLLDTGRVRFDKVVGKPGLNMLEFAFREAVKAGRGAVVEILLGLGKFDLNCQWNDRPVFHWAALSGDLGVVKALVATGQIDIDVRDQYDRSALYMAVRRGHKDVVLFLLNTGKADIDVWDTKERTSLFIEAKYGECMDIRTAVLERGLATGQVRDCEPEMEDDPNPDRDDKFFVVPWPSTEYIP